MARFPLLAVLTSLIVLPELAAAQDITYDWTTRELTGLPRHAGGAYRIEVRNLSPICFTTSAHVEVRQSAFDAAAARRIVTPPAQPQPGADTDAARPGVEGTVREAVLLLRDPVHRAEETERKAIELVAQTERALARLENQRALAHRITTMLAAVEADCARAWDTSRLLDEWRQVGDSLLAAMRTAPDTLAAARGYLDTASGPIGDTGPVAGAIARQRAEHARLETALLRLPSQVEATAPRLNTALVRSTLTRVVDTNSEAEGIRLILTSRPVTGGEVQADTVDIPLRRRHRVVFSTGLVATGANSRHYERVNRQGVREGGPPDSVFSTFGVTSGNTMDLINPALMANVSLSDLVHGMDLYLSVGTTLRNVNAQTALEPLIGISYGIIDRLFLQIGLHFGREEELLISQPGPVPVAITRNDAVGTRWVGAFHGGFTLRIN